MSQEHKYSYVPTEFAAALIAEAFKGRITPEAAETQLKVAAEDHRWPMLNKFHLLGLMVAYNEGYSKAVDGRAFDNPFAKAGSQAAAWELGTQDGAELRTQREAQPGIQRRTVTVAEIAAEVDLLRVADDKGPMTTNRAYAEGVNETVDAVLAILRGEVV